MAQHISHKYTRRISGVILGIALSLSACSFSERSENAESEAAETASTTTEVMESAVSGAQLIAEPATDQADAEEADDSEAASSSYWAIVDVPVGLNVRAGAGTSFAIVAQVTKDQILTGTGSIEGDWVEVSVDEVTGWVHGGYLVASDAPETTETPEADTATAAAGSATGEILIVTGVPAGLNIRSGPGTEFNLVHGAPVGTSGIATGNTEAGWTEITIEGVTGWALSTYLEPVG